MLFYRVTYNFTYETGFSGEEIIYFDPIQVKLMEENPFKTESGNYPVDFGYVTQLTYVSDYTLPENLSVDELPKNLVMKLPENTGEFKRIIKAEDNKISMIITLTITQSHFEPVIMPIYASSLISSYLSTTIRSC